ncbi:serpin-ZX [Artemisia annua]|uniref:Serpin-ZX n=1 Tax=Artemisia annua TaxID=35608 RepID=A0A2U1LRG3_ARTAN|nr:serpin-ZX [Artemisia annua]
MTLYEKCVKNRSFNGYKMIRFPYKSNDRSNKFSMYIFLPDRRDGLQHLLELFHSDDDLFHGDFDLEQETLASLWIPKFKISTTFEPEDVMKELGLTLPFEKTNKEFSGLKYLLHGDFDLEQETLASLWIPKFKISTTFEPEDVMKELGLTLHLSKKPIKSLVG